MPSEDQVGDHVIPYSKGGRTHEDNLEVLHDRCNKQKGNKQL